MAKETDVPTEDLMLRPFGEWGKWRIESYAGKSRTGTSVVDLWNCVCECGAKQVIQKSNLVRHRSTQCRRCGYDKRSKGLRLYLTLWQNHRSEMCDEWQDYAAFDAWCVNRDERILRRHDESKPYSPENCWWSAQMRCGDEFRTKVAELRVKLLGETEDDAFEWVYTVSRQRLHQWWDVYGGDADRRERYKARAWKSNSDHRQRHKKQKARNDLTPSAFG